jgi:hypothetical protein
LAECKALHGSGEMKNGKAPERNGGHEPNDYPVDLNG